MRLVIVLTCGALLPAASLLFVGACGGAAFHVGAGDAQASGEDASAVDGAASFCALEAGSHTFCDDFDGLPLASMWDSIDDNGGSATQDTSVFVSAPRSFDSTTNPSFGATNTSRGRITKGFGKASRVRVAFDARLDAEGDAQGPVGGMSILTINVGSGYNVGINVNTQYVGYFENVTDAGVIDNLGGKHLVATSTFQSFTHVEVDADLNGGKLSITINGTRVLDSQSISPPDGASVGVSLGMFSRNVGANGGAHFDDVTVDTSG